jgi:parvulin-like peptidyl-prolyl isomerase
MKVSRICYTAMINKFISKSRVILLSGIFLLIACDKINMFSRPYVAEVNGSKIYLDEYQERLAQKKSMLSKELLSNQANYAQRMEEEVLESIITEKIIYIRAQELGIAVSSEELEKKLDEIKKEYGTGFSSLFIREKLSFEQWKEEIKKEILFEKLIAADVNSRITVSEDEAEDYFNEHKDLYKTESKVRVAQIVVRDAVAAQQALQRLNAGADFFKVAREKSIGPEALRGGDLGFITRQIMPEPLDETIFNLRLNEVSSVVQSPYGFHIFKVLEIQPAKIKNFAESKEEVVADIRTQKEEVAFVSWLSALKSKAVIKKEHAVLRNKIN